MWREAQGEAGDLWAAALAAKLQGSAAASEESRRLATEVRDRLRGLYGDIDDYTGRLTADQMSELAYHQSVVERLERVRAPV